MTHEAMISLGDSETAAAGVRSTPESRESIQLRWLARMRWAIIVSLFAIFFGANHYLQLELPERELFLLFVCLVLSNVPLVLIRNPSERAYAWISRAALLVDVLGLTALLYFCGGYTNPFSMMFLAYVTLAAVVLDARWTWIVFGISLCCLFAIFFTHIPLPQLGMGGAGALHAHHQHHAVTQGFSLHLHGMLVAFVIIAGVVASFVTRMSREIEDQAAAIDRLRRMEDERSRLVALATLTAGAAHELATPVSTLTLIGEELADVLSSDPRWSEDIETMQTELARCSTILQRMRGGGVELDGEVPRTFELRGIIQALKEEFVGNRDGVEVIFEGEPNATVRICSFHHALVSSLTALLTNAVQACGVRGGFVRCVTEVSEREVAFSITDTGEGMSTEIVRRAGEPFFTSKPPGKGMGLGLYLTKLFALQVGGSLSIVSKLGEGTHVLLRVPRSIKV